MFPTIATHRSAADREFELFRSSGDRRALGSVFSATVTPLRTAARRLTRDRDRADDLVQSTFVVAMNHAAEYDVARPVTGWLIGILVNVHRRERRRAERRVDFVRLPPPPPAESPEVAIECDDAARAIRAAIDDLGPAYRPVLRLHLTEGMPLPDIADALGRNKSTVRTQFVRGLEALRRTFGECA